MRTIAIGDIHGCRASLEALVEYAGISEGDTLVTLGDYVDRGPDSKGVIDPDIKVNRKDFVYFYDEHDPAHLRKAMSAAHAKLVKSAGTP